jgi:hypothetical protein
VSEAGRHTTYLGEAGSEEATGRRPQHFLDHIQMHGIDPYACWAGQSTSHSSSASCAHSSLQPAFYNNNAGYLYKCCAQFIVGSNTRPSGTTAVVFESTRRRQR